jgi:hypothetical protein
MWPRVWISRRPTLVIRRPTRVIPATRQCRMANDEWQINDEWRMTKNFVVRHSAFGID